MNIDPEVVARAMQKIASNNDTEQAHAMADCLMRDLLDQLGFTKAMTIYEQMPKWYA